MAQTPAQAVQLDAPIALAILDARRGALVDLEGDPIADPHHDEEAYAFELATVVGTRALVSDAVELEFSDGETITFPAGHVLTCWGSDPDHED